MSNGKELRLGYGKEYQIVLNPQSFNSKEEIIEIVNNTFSELEGKLPYFKVKSIEGNKFTRHVKFLTSEVLAFNNLKLSLGYGEKGGSEFTRIKLKYNSTDADTCLAPDITKSFIYPAYEYISPVDAEEQISKIKFEADLYPIYTKFGFSAKIEVEGIKELNSIAEAKEYFLGLGLVKNLSDSSSLMLDKSYHEYVVDDIKLRIGIPKKNAPEEVKWKKAKATLSLRYLDANLTNLLKGELSFKLKSKKEQWNYQLLVRAGQLFYELLQFDFNYWKGKDAENVFRRPADF